MGLARPALDWSDARCRYRLYALLALVFFTVGLLLANRRAVFRGQEFTLIGVDGHYYYVYLPALLLDGSLDISTRIRNHWGHDFKPELLADRTERGYVRNKYPIGLALTLLPAFLLGHVLSIGLYALTGSPHFLPNGYTLVYQLVNFSWITVLGLASLVLVDALLIKRFRLQPRSVALGIVVVWLGSPLGYYWFREPYMVHTVSTFWVLTCLTLLGGALAEIDAGPLAWWRLPLLTAAGAMALVCRPTNVFLWPFFVYLLVKLLASPQWRRWLAHAPLVVLGLFPVLAQTLVWHGMTGRWIHYSYGDEGFHWRHPAAMA